MIDEIFLEKAVLRDNLVFVKTYDCLEAEMESPLLSEIIRFTVYYSEKEKHWKCEVNAIRRHSGDVRLTITSFNISDSLMRIIRHESVERLKYIKNVLEQ